MKYEISNKVLSDLTLLLIIPNEKYRSELKKALELKVNKVISVASIKDAVVIYNTESIDFIISELILGDENSLSFCKSLRNINKNIPIIKIGNVVDTQIFLEMIRLKITEYIVKPVQVSLLKEALHVCATDIYDSGLYEIRFEKSFYNVRKKLLLSNETKQEIMLSANEIKLLDLLVYNKNIILTKDAIMDSIWENSYEMSDEALKSLLSRLRQKIGKTSIKNISGTGYTLNI